MEEGVKKLLLRTDPNKACGPDGIISRLLKTVADKINPFLTLLFRISYYTGILTSDWKLVHTTPVFKGTIQSRKLPSYLPNLHNL